jgi:hypothetical protein
MLSAVGLIREEVVLIIVEGKGEVIKREEKEGVGGTGKRVDRPAIYAEAGSVRAVMRTSLECDNLLAARNRR